jgi:hypothetical protein
MSDHEPLPGGPGVGSSNLPAPTIFSNVFESNETRTATQLPPDCHRAARRHWAFEQANAAT